MSTVRTIHNLRQQKYFSNALGHKINTSNTSALFKNMLNDPTIYKLMDELKEWDEYSYHHSVDVFELGVLLAEEVGIANIKKFGMGCLLHDIGKKYIPQKILQKKGKLTPEEFDLMQDHTILGYHHLREEGFDRKTAKLAMSHHERLNGTGYPHGLTSNQIDKECATLMVVDVFSAVTSERPYRSRLTDQEGVDLLWNERAKFEETILFSFFKLLEKYPDYLQL